MDDLQIKVDELCKKFDKYDDTTLMFYFSRNQNVFIKDYLKKRKYNILYDELEKRIVEQRLFEKKLEKIIAYLEQLDIKIIGLKGYFLQKTYYKNYTRLYKDLDILIAPENCYSVFSNLRNLNYSIKKDTFLFYNNKFLFKIFKRFYANNVHSIDLIKNLSVQEYMTKWEKVFLLCPIDLSCNLNIDSACHFDHKQIFLKSSLFEMYKNIYQPNEYHNILYLIYHMMRHLVFYKYDSRLMSINIQKIIDVALIIDSLGDTFDFKKLIELSKIYNIFPDVLFYFNIYNKIGFSERYFSIENFLDDKNLNKCKWKFILERSYYMEVEDILLGNYPELNYLYTAIEKNNHIKNQNIRRFNIRKSINKEKQK